MNVFKKAWNALLGQEPEEQDGPVGDGEESLVMQPAPQPAPQPAQPDAEDAPEKEESSPQEELPPLLAVDADVPSVELQETVRLLCYHDPNGRVRLAKLAERGGETATALLKMLDAAEGGDPFQQFLLGREYQFGSVLPRNYRMAARCYLLAYNHSEPHAYDALKKLLHHHQDDLSWILDESATLRRLNDEVTAEKMAERRERIKKEEEARRRREEERGRKIQQRMQETAAERAERLRKEEERIEQMRRQAEERARQRAERAEREKAELEAQTAEAYRTQTLQLDLSKQLAARKAAQEEARLARLARKAEQELRQREAQVEKELRELERQREEAWQQTQKKEEKLQQRQEYFKQRAEEEKEKLRQQAQAELAERESRQVEQVKKQAQAVLQTVEAKNEQLAAAEAERKARIERQKKRRAQRMAEAQQAIKAMDVEAMEQLAQVFRYGEEDLPADWQMQARLESQAKLCKGDPAALVRVGNNFQFGLNGYEKDLDEAFDFYELAGSLEHMESVLRDWKEQGDAKGAREHVERYFNACTDPRQRAVICSNVEFGYWYPPDKEKAYELCLMSGDVQQAENVAYRISEMYRNQLDAAKSYYWLLRSGSKKNTIQRRMLAEAALFETGTGGRKKDLQRAYSLYVNAERPEEAARVALRISEAYAHGEDDWPCDEEQAVEWRRRAGQRPYTLI